MEACERLKREHPDCWVNTHVSENPAEVRGVLAEHHDCADYLGVYEKYGLVGPKFSGGHGVWLSDDEFRRLVPHRRRGHVLPLLQSLPRQRPVPSRPRHRSQGAREAVVGHRHGRRQPLLHAFRARRRLQGRHVQQHAARRQRRPRQAGPRRGGAQQGLALSRLLVVTLGGAEGLYIDDKVGNFEPGKEADFVALDWNGGPPGTAWHQSLVVDGTGPQSWSRQPTCCSAS